jgi:hypothetical protein
LATSPRSERRSNDGSGGAWGATTSWWSEASVMPPDTTRTTLSTETTATSSLRSCQRAAGTSRTPRIATWARRWSESAARKRLSPLEAPASSMAAATTVTARAPRTVRARTWV